MSTTALFIPRLPPLKTEVEAASFSIEGPKGQNDDRLLDPFICGKDIIAAIADGVGGTAGGGRAAELALDTLKTGLTRNCQTAFSDLFALACRRMRDEAAASADLARMATTLSAVRLNGAMAEVAHVGDTRIYHLRGSGIVTRTQDQTEVAELLRLNVLSAEQAKRYPRRNVITSYLGPDARYDLLSATFPICAGDTIVLLTDGVYNEVKKTELAQMHLVTDNVLDFKAAVESRLMELGTRDDSSFVALRV